MRSSRGLQMLPPPRRSLNIKPQLLQPQSATVAMATRDICSDLQVAQPSDWRRRLRGGVGGRSIAVSWTFSASRGGWGASAGPSSSCSPDPGAEGLVVQRQTSKVSPGSIGPLGVFDLHHCIRSREMKEPKAKVVVVVLLLVLFTQRNIFVSSLV